MPVVNALKILLRAQACCARVPEREISERTRRAYEKEVERMWRCSRSLDPLTNGIARATYNFRRAALASGSVAFLESRMARVFEAGDRGDATAAVQRARELLRAVEAVEHALELEPPTPEGASPWQSKATRWHESSDDDRESGEGSKRDSLPLLPHDWDARLWKQAVAGGFDDLPALAVQCITGARSEDLSPGERSNGWSTGAMVELRSANHLSISIAPAKSHLGKYGTELTTFTVDWTIVGGPAAFLAKQCKSFNGNRFVVSLESKDVYRKAMKDFGRIALPEIDVAITPNVLRHQKIADFKATFGAGAVVAAAAGQGTDRTQAKYGRVQHGRRLEGYVSIVAARSPRCGNVERARRLSERKEPKDKK
jgi:hypothetical protein